MRVANIWTKQVGNVTLEAELSLSDESFDVVDEDRQRFFLERFRFFAANLLDSELVRVSYTGHRPPAGGGSTGTINKPPTATAAVATISGKTYVSYR